MPFCGHLTTLYVFNTRICKLNKKYVIDSYAPENFRFLTLSCILTKIWGLKLSLTMKSCCTTYYHIFEVSNDRLRTLHMLGHYIFVEKADFLNINVYLWKYFYIHPVSNMLSSWITQLIRGLCLFYQRNALLLTLHNFSEKKILPPKILCFLFIT